ncbi:MAG: holo-[acyl-carrier-protein] synthase [Anaerolineaceae bacterium]|nr:holo-[acyl-carrier-protein] synthase [Anaerolineaceae bacterium]
MSISILRTGVDLIEISRLVDLEPKIKTRFLDRVYTTREKEICGENQATLAGRFAAKEAVSKALGSGIGEIHWQDIEILKGDEGEPILHLHQKALERSNQLGIKIWSISISHNKTTAVAYVVGIG